MARRRTRGKRTRGKRTRRKRTKSRRKTRRKSKRTRKSRRRRTRQRGGNVKVNPLNQKVQTYPVSTYDTNPRNPAQNGGKRRKRKKTKKKYKGGGSLLRSIGLGDAIQGYYSANDAVSNTINRWGGKQRVVSSNPIKQPKMMKIPSAQYKIPNIPDYYDKASTKAAKHILK
jgi:hypothetical protein